MAIKSSVANLISDYRQSGRTAFLYKRGTMVSLNGMKAIPIEEGVIKMRLHLQLDAERETQVSLKCDPDC